jgi:hypothetical protein
MLPLAITGGCDPDYVPGCDHADAALAMHSAILMTSQAAANQIMFQVGIMLTLPLPCILPY